LSSQPNPAPQPESQPADEEDEDDDDKGFEIVEDEAEATVQPDDDDESMMIVQPVPELFDPREAGATALISYINAVLAMDPHLDELLPIKEPRPKRPPKPTMALLGLAMDMVKSGSGISDPQEEEEEEEENAAEILATALTDGVVLCKLISKVLIPLAFQNAVAD